ncbi:MAG: hypothetical protein RQ757_07415 [Pseudomonadales bacterium]|nr:hypothetical protein [Pseudomonadales bacterium]
MSQHDNRQQEYAYDEAEADANSKADTLAMLGFVLVIVAMAVYYVSR